MSEPVISRTAAADSLPSRSLPMWRFVVMASRPGFWITSIWFFMLPLGGTDVLHRPLFWLGALYITFPFGLFIYGLNDVADGDADLLNPRKGTYLFGARGDARQLGRLPMIVLLMQLPFWGVFLYSEGPRFLLWIAALAVFTAVYNWPGIAWKNRPGLDVLNQGGYLLVFVIASMLLDVPQLSVVAMLFGALFAMHSHLFSEVMDLEPDRLAGRRTTAIVIGVVRCKCLVALLLAVEGALLAHGLGHPVIGALFPLVAAFFVFDALYLSRDATYSPHFARLAFTGWNVFAVVSLPWIWKHALFVS